MKQVRNKLLILFWTLLLVALLLVVLFETETLSSGLWTGQLTAEFLCRCFMEVLTLAGVWLALRLMHFQKVHADLMQRKETALGKWATLRLLLLELPMVVNTLLYYMYMQTTYGYMAIIALLALPFVYPSKSRCQDEIEEEKIEEKRVGDVKEEEDAKP